MELRLHEVTCVYPGSQIALEAVSLHVRSGDCYGFLGHNGAGKTTALRVALGLLRPRSGTVLVDGFDAARHPREARARMGGLVERPGFHDGLSGDRNLRLLAAVQGLRGAAAAQEAQRVLAAVGLTDVGARKPVGAYSQGMRQRLGIAQALLGRPPLVLLDEPTNGLDPEGIEEMRRLFRRLVEEDGTTLLVSSHQLHEVAGLCNRVGILREGRLLLEEETAGLLGGGRVRLLAGEPAAAQRVLDDRALGYEREDGGFVVDVVGDEADALLPALVEAGALPRSFTPHATSLEDVYLRVSRGGATGATPPGAAPVPASPDRRRAPAAAVGRATGYELRRLASTWAVPLALLLPAAIAAAAVGVRYANARGFATEVASGDLASTTSVTAFEGVATALRAGLPVLALVVTALGSQQIAGERSRGTLRNLLLRPLTRVEAALGKVAGLAVATLAGHVALSVTALAVSALLFDFTDVNEVLWNGELFPLVPAAELWPPLRHALWSPLPAVFACAGLGLAAGSLVRRPAAGLALALGLLGILDAGRAVLAGFGAAHLSPLQYVPTWLRDRSFVRHFMDLSQGVSNTSFEHGSAELGVPLAWVVVTFAVAAVALSRRPVR